MVGFWKNDQKLEHDLKKYVAANMQRLEILDFMRKNYSAYKSSLRTLGRRLRHFGIYYIDSNMPLEVTREAVKKELDGPGAMLGYRAMTLKIRQKNDVKVPRALVHDLMFELDPDGLARRAPGTKAKKATGHFVTIGPNWTYSMDGHDKTMGYQSSTFPIAIYGCIDTASRKLIWLKVWTTNSNPLFVGNWYLQSLLETGILPNHIRLDKGTETTSMSTIQAYLRSQQGNLEDPTNSILFGPSTSNQVCTPKILMLFLIYI